MLSLARFLSKHSQEEEVAGQEMPERHGSRRMFFFHLSPPLGFTIICFLAFNQGKLERWQEKKLIYKQIFSTATQITQVKYKIKSFASNPEWTLSTAGLGCFMGTL